MARVILIKKSNGYLVSAKAESFETDGGFVQLSDAVDLGDGNKTQMVPKELCYNFDSELMHKVNHLLLMAEENTKAAIMWLECNAEQATFEGEELPFTMH